MEVVRGQTRRLFGYRSEGDIQLTIPLSEKDEDHIFRLKAGETLIESEFDDFLVAETVFDTFLSAYANGLSALFTRSYRGSPTINTPEGSGFRRRKSTAIWEVAHQLAVQAQTELREATTIRCQDGGNADRIALQGLKTLQRR
jgi:hypothetical protein